MKNPIKAIREILKLSQAELAEKSGVTQSTIAKIELGRHLTVPQGILQYLSGEDYVPGLVVEGYRKWLLEQGIVPASVEAEPSVALSIRIPVWLSKAIRWDAQQTGKSLSEITREILKAHYEARGQG